MQDSIEYADPETINGLNLYAYCGNNPVMRVDENGNAWWHWLFGALVVVAATIVTAGVAAGAALAIGTAVGFLLELEINGKSIIDHIRDAVYDFWKWLLG